ncbi:hypothetical protein AJ80_05485 [Polytolypa hystricis UAMH7299]|uniref:Uncharacterized protein n=1 Tax=Polytolypa hystricis (strain UAMH7299) TaxID=1447883 RepID=A0A2B7Y2Z4_POLH7|nr:hypothetical protein AJ80_05485 [Polytolypa hystricis UAMH7299]
MPLLQLQLSISAQHVREFIRLVLMSFVGPELLLPTSRGGQLRSSSLSVSSAVRQPQPHRPSRVPTADCPPAPRGYG